MAHSKRKKARRRNPNSFFDSLTLPLLAFVVIGGIVLVTRKADAAPPGTVPVAEPHPAKASVPRLTSPGDVGVFATVTLGEDRVVEPGQIGEISRAAGADPLSVQSYVHTQLLAYSDEVVHVYTADADGTVLGSWSWIGTEAKPKLDTHERPEVPA